MKMPIILKGALGALAAFAALGAFAEPSVTVNRVAQRYPWNGLVDIDFTVADAPDPFYYAVEFEVSGTRNGQAFAVKPATFLAGEPALSNGLNRVTWNATADGETFQSRSCAVTAKLRFKPIKTDGDYMIVDLAGGTNAALWRVTYVSGVADPEATFNTDEYKTTKIVLKKCPAGTFMMGSTDDTTSPYYDDEATLNDTSTGENPRHQVTLTKPFFLGVFKLTDEQYRMMTGTNTSYNGQYLKDKPTYPCGGLSRNFLNSSASFLPILNAKALCMGTAVGTFGLPTEAQWEYACRAGTTTRRFFDETTEALSDYAETRANTFVEVGTKKPNPWGFYDQYGLLFEHVKDETGKYPDTAETDPCHLGGWGAILRSASVSSEAKVFRSAGRVSGSKSNAASVYGVRLALTAD